MAAAPVAVSAMRPAVVETAPESAEPLQAEVFAAVQPAPTEPVLAVAQPAVAPEPPPAPRQPVVETVRASGGMMRGLFQKATGLGGIGGMMKRTLPEAPVAAPVAPTLRVEPSMAAPATAAPARPAMRPAQQEDMGLEIPTFLRRQSNY